MNQLAVGLLVRRFVLDALVECCVVTSRQRENTAHVNVGARQ